MQPGAWNRGRSRHLRPLVVCVSAALAGLPLPAALAAVLPVTSCLDDFGTGTLRSVVDSAVDGDVVDLSGLDCGTLTLTEGPIDTSWAGAHSLDELTIQGPGRDRLTLSGGGRSLIFSVGGEHFSANNVFTLSDVTVADGINSGSIFYESPACIFGLRGTVVLNRVTVTNCHSTFLGGANGGGAVGVDLLQISDSLITNNTLTSTGGETAQGGGAWAAGTMVVVNSTISGNQLSGLVETDAYGGQEKTGGGGLYASADLTLVNSTIAGNSVEATNPDANGRGGGVFVRGTATIVGSTIEGNVTDGEGGGLYKMVFSNAFDPGSELTLQNSTLSGNIAGGAGGGFVSERRTQLDNSTIAFNTSTGGGAVLFRRTQIDPGMDGADIQSSILAGNLVLDHTAPYAADLAADGALTITGANNLVVDADRSVLLPAGTLNADPLLLPLAANGGPTRTHALATGSPAINTGNNAATLAFDQRGEGYPRESGGRADIGAFEVQLGDAVFGDGFDP